MAVALIVCIIGYIVGPEYFQLIGKVALAGAHDLIDIFKTVVKSLGSTEKKMWLIKCKVYKIAENITHKQILLKLKSNSNSLGNAII